VGWVDYSVLSIDDQDLTEEQIERPVAERGGRARSGR
jgi:hypothetical protein